MMLMRWFFQGQVVAAVVAETSEIAKAAVGAVVVDYAAESPDVALRTDRPDLYAPDKLMAGFDTDSVIGDVDGALAAAAVTVDGGTVSFGGGVKYGELVERLELSQPSTSKHLRVLRDAGFVTVRPSGPLISWTCRCGAVELPVLPTRPRTSPVRTLAPGCTATLPGARWA